MKNYLKKMFAASKYARHLLPPASILIDVSLSKDFEKSHVKEAINIPLHTLSNLVDLIAQFNKEIVIISNSESTSRTACNILSAKGLKVIDGGDWTKCKDDYDYYQKDNGATTH